MTKYSVEGLNGPISVGDPVAWFSKRYGKRTGKVRKITIGGRYGGRDVVRLSILPDKKDDRSYWPCRQSLFPDKVALIPSVTVPNENLYT